MLKDLEQILDKPENDHMHERDFEAAASYLLQKQSIWADGHGQKRHYDLMVRFSDYFETLFDAIGFDFVRDYKYGYCGILPRSGLPVMRKFDTLILLLLAKMHDEQSRKACTERGCSTPCLGVLLDLYTQLTGLEKPTRPDLLASLKTLARHGVIQIGDMDEQLNLPKITVTPAITHVVTADFLTSLEAYSEHDETTINFDEDADDDLEQASSEEIGQEALEESAEATIQGDSQDNDAEEKDVTHG
ncbi:MAG TPA: hypothetical protein DHW71_02720 [Gammaproteobacteria bacterium]|nr:hypothetical protein [Gammaproteobacteria bacterium]